MIFENMKPRTSWVRSSIRGSSKVIPEINLAILRKMDTSESILLNLYLPIIN